MGSQPLTLPRRIWLRRRIAAWGVALGCLGAAGAPPAAATDARDGLLWRAGHLPSHGLVHPYAYHPRFGLHPFAQPFGHPGYYGYGAWGWGAPGFAVPGPSARSPAVRGDVYVPQARPFSEPLPQQGTRQRYQALPQESNPDGPSFDREWVYEMQMHLGALGYDPGPPDGAFGQATARALIAFQNDSRLPATGQPTPSAMQALRAHAMARAAPPEAPPGMPAPAELSRIQLVYETQDSLNVLGYDAGPVDGTFGRQTAEAIGAFQRDRGVPVDGQVSAGLVAELRSALGLDVVGSPPGGVPSN